MLTIQNLFAADCLQRELVALVVATSDIIARTNINKVGS
jgi:hypothetical protein